MGMRRRLIYLNNDFFNYLADRFNAYKSRHDRSLVLNAAYIWLANLLPGIFGVIFWWLASRFYSPSQVGLASATISAASLLALLSRLGLDISLIRFLPETNNQEKLLNSVFSFGFIVNVFVTGLYIFLIPVLSPKLHELTTNAYYSIGFFFLSNLSMVTAIMRAVYIGKRESKYSIWTSLIANIGRIIIIAWGSFLGAAGIVSAVLGGVALSVFAGFTSYLPGLIRGYKIRLMLNWNLISSIIIYSIGNSVADFVMLAPQTILPLMILNLLGETSSGHAYVALMIGSMLAGLGLALGRSAFAEGANRLNESQNILRNAALVGSLVTLPLAIITTFMAPWILSIFGQSYVIEATGLLRWVAISSPMTVLIQLFYTKLRINQNIKLLIGLSLFNVIVTLIISRVGLQGLGIPAVGIGVLSGNLLTIQLIVYFYPKSKLLINT